MQELFHLIEFFRSQMHHFQFLVIPVELAEINFVFLFIAEMLVWLISYFKRKFLKFEPGIEPLTSSSLD